MATQRTAAEHLGMSVRTFQNLRAAGAFGPGGHPRGRAGYDLDVLRRAYIRHLESRGAEATPAAGLDPAQERARRDAAAADKLEHEVAVARGEHVAAAVVAERIAAVFAEAARELDAAVARLRAKHPDAPELLAECEAEIHRARTRIADG